MGKGSERTDDGGGDGRQRAPDRLVLKAARRSPGGLAVLALAAMAGAVAETAFPAVLGRAVDSVLDDGSRAWLVWCGVLIALVVACDVADDLAGGVVTARATAWLRHRLTGHVVALGARGADRFPSGEVSSRLVGNAADAGGVAPNLVAAVAAVVPAIGATVALGLIDPWLCLTFLAGLPILVGMLRAFSRDASDKAARYLQVQGAMAGRLADALAGARTIAAAGTLRRESARVLADLPALHAHGLGMWRVEARVAAQDALLVPLIEILVLAVAGLRLADGRITPGELLATAQYVALGAGVGSAVSAVGQLARARAGAARVAEVLATEPPRYGDAVLPAGHGALELRGVTVVLDGRRALDRVDLVVPAATSMALVGHSGAGKSLLAAVAARLVDPDEGSVVLDGVVLSELDRDQLRREVTYGFERPVLIGRTVAEAIAFGPEGASMADVVEAAASAQADGFIRRLPSGYQTALADAPMSGGELQRVGLARVLAHAGRLVVLDDVAASLDTVTEHNIAEVLAGTLAGHTRLVVAHRAVTAARADVVAWLEAGRLRGLGPHGELWRHAEYRAVFGEPDHAETAEPAAASGDLA